MPTLSSTYVTWPYLKVGVYNVQMRLLAIRTLIGNTV